MASTVRMPEVLAGVSEAVLSEWLVREGAVVAVGDKLAEIETEKAVVEYNSEVAGRVGQLLVEAGAHVEMGSPIAIILAVGESMDDMEHSAAVSPVAAAPEDEAPSTLVEDVACPSPEGPEPRHPRVAADVSSLAVPTRLFASPLVRQLASKNGVDLSQVRGTGPQDRIVRRDLERHLATVAQTTPVSPAEPALAAVAAPPTTPSVAGPPPPLSAVTYVDTDLTAMRRAIARRLTESKSTVPHIYLSGDCVVDRLLALRADINAVASERVSVNDLVVKAVGAAFRQVPEANVIWVGDAVRQFDQVDVSVAIAIEGGLITPVLRDVGRLTVGEIGRQTRDFAQRAKAGRIKQHEIEGGSFSVTNLGMYGTTAFAAILNPPQSGILAVGAAVKKPWVVDGKISVATVMTVTLSVDHRVIDGALAARWLSAFVAAVENPLATAVS